MASDIILDSDMTEYLPHNLSFLNDKDSKENSYLYSTLYCLTNLNLYMKCSLQEVITEISKNDSMRNNYFKMMKFLGDYIKDNSKKKEDVPDEVLQGIEKFKNDYIKNCITTFTELKKDPRDLIKYIFAILLNLQKQENSSIMDNSSNKNNFLNDIDNSIGIGCENSYAWSNKIENYDDKYNIFIKGIDKENNIKYRFSSFLRFALTEEEKTMDEYFKDYLNKAKDDHMFTNVSKNDLNYGENIYYKFPESITILINYGNNEKEPYKCHYNINEILDFTNAPYVDQDNIKYKKYYLSSIIVCKFPNEEENKFYYTYCRKDKNSKFIIYNSKDNQVNEIKDDLIVMKHLKNQKGDKINRVKSYPYVLVYNAFNDEN